MPELDGLWLVMDFGRALVSGSRCVCERERESEREGDEW